MELQTFVNLGGFIGMLAYIILQDWRTGKLTRNATDYIPPWAAKLTEHFNHDTTINQTTIIDELRKIVQKLSDVHDCLKKANVKIDEMQKYGVKNLKD